MSRSWLCLATAAMLAAASIVVLSLRFACMGWQALMPTGPDTWQITLVAHGRTVSADAQLSTVAPLELPTQHLLREDCSSEMLDCRAVDADGRHRRRHIWTLRPGQETGPFHLRCEFVVSLYPSRSQANRQTSLAYAPPQPGEYVDSELHIESDHPEIGELARAVVAERSQVNDQLEALYRMVSTEILNEPTVAGESRSALGCMRRGAGDCTAKSRLLVALARNRGIAARLVVGLTQSGDNTHSPHVWVEAYDGQRWKPMCPFYRHYGKLPRAYTIFTFDDPRLVRGRGIRHLDYGYLIEKITNDADSVGQSWLARQFLATSPHMLAPAERQLVEFLLLLPLAALIVCVFRNVIGLHTFGTFAPALVGLAFREQRYLPGLMILLAILLVGWLLRHLLDRLHLLQVPRTACMLSLVVMMLLGVVLLAQQLGYSATHYISLFPLVILTGMIERFWTQEAEDSTAASLCTLLATMAVAGTIGLAMSLTAVTRYLLSFPETLGLILAGQLLLGRYTGYRLSELLRFRDLLDSTGPPAPAVACALPNGALASSNGAGTLPSGEVALPDRIVQMQTVRLINTTTNARLGANL